MLSDARELDRFTLYTGGLEAKFQTVLLGMSDESASCTSGEVGSGSEDRSAEEQDEDEGLSRDEHSPSEGSQSDGDTDGSHLGGDVIDSSSCSSAPSSSDHATDDTSCSTEEDGLEETLVKHVPLESHTWFEHLRRFGSDHRCPRCRWMRDRAAWIKELTYQDSSGEVGSWVEEVHGPGRPWGLGCKVCRWAGLTDIFARGLVRGDRNTQLTALKRHGGHLPTMSRTGRQVRCAQGHAFAQAKLLAEDSERRLDPDKPPRNDVPGLPLFFNAYKNAKDGASFCSFTRDVKVLRAAGAPIPKSRDSRFVAKNIVEVIATELQSEDHRLISNATDIALTMDARSSMLVIRTRLSMGHKWPEGLRAMGGGATPSSMGGGATPSSMGSSAATDEAAHTGYREVPHVYGKGVPVVERIIGYRREGAFGGTQDLVNLLIDSFRDACGGDDVYESARRRVRVFCPDGAANEQLVGRLITDAFPNLCFVIRCSAHAAQGAIKTAWRADDEVQRITQTVVCEVAKFLRSSSRFELRFQAKAREGILTAVSNFDFAPQRFSSKERPLTRCVLYAEAVLITLGLEVTAATSQERAQWALEILRQLQGPTWLLIGMLADLAEDAAKFVRLFDRRDIDPIAFAQHLSNFVAYVQREYVNGGMWLRRTGTYAKRITDMLADEKLMVFKDGYVIVTTPTREETNGCIARATSAAAVAVAEAEDQRVGRGSSSRSRGDEIDSTQNGQTRTYRVEGSAVR